MIRQRVPQCESLEGRQLMSTLPTITVVGHQVTIVQNTDRVVLNGQSVTVNGSPFYRTPGQLYPGIGLTNFAVVEVVTNGGTHVNDTMIYSDNYFNPTPWDVVYDNNTGQIISESL